MENSKSTMSAAKFSLGKTVVFLVLLMTLHFIKPEIAPSWRFISEYEIGKYGWIMQSAFIALAFSQIALFVSVQSYLKSAWGRIGLALLLVNTLGLFLAGIFVTDSIMTPNVLTKSGQLHNLGGSLGIAGFFGTLLISWKLFRNKNWASARRAILWSMGLVIVGFFVSIISL